MNIVDLANCMAPNLRHEIIGIRPGEKIHEVMVTRDDARNTIELEQCFVIEPAMTFWSRKPYIENGAKPVPEDFEYSSNTNRQWLDADGLKRLLREAGLL